MKNSKVLTTSQAAKLANVSPATMLRAVSSGLIKSFTTPGGHYRVREEDAKKYLENKIPTAKMHTLLDAVKAVLDTHYDGTKPLWKTLKDAWRHCKA